MRRLIYLRSAQRDLGDIYRHIARESGSEDVAQQFTERLRKRCRALADLSGTMGRSREELLPDIRSVPEGNYAVFFSYAPGTLTIIAIVHSARNLRRLFPRP